MKKKDLDSCKCGQSNSNMFDCVCSWIKKNPGDNHYSCEYCGFYKASKPRCNCCQKETN